MPSILNGNLANLALTDAGYFGKGVYGTPDAEYAWRVYSKRGGMLLFCCFSFYSAYPVVGVRDMRKLEGQPNYGNYDAHVVPVVPRDPQNPNEADYYPAEAGGAPLSTYMELVVFESSQILPRFIVEVAPSRIPRPLSLRASGVIPREVPLQYVDPSSFCIGKLQHDVQVRTAVRWTQCQWARGAASSGCLAYG